MNPNSSQGPDIKNLMIALVAATTIMVSWQYFYERPRVAAMQAAQAVEAAKINAQPKTEIAAAALKPTHAAHDSASETVGPRLKINTASLHGSLALTGGRIDDLTLAKYAETNEKNSPEVKLLSPAGAADSYFAEVGVLAAEAQVPVPDARTVWQTDSDELTSTKPVTLRWNNGAGLQFEKTIALDEHYMFTITTTVKNTGAAPVTLYPYGLVSRNYADTAKHNIILHEGPLGVMQGALEDISYEKLREEGPQKFDGSKGWIGMTDKYWLTALVPDKNAVFDAEFKYFTRGESDAYQADVRGEALEVPVGGASSFTLRVFAGAKEVRQLDAYAAQYSIPLFDRAVDFGSLYFLTKPIFSLMNYFHGLVGNFGVAILLLTVVIKAVLFPLANKSLTAMSRTKMLMPQVQEIRDRHSDDKMKMNQEIMALYKREKVNPVAGCLPILLQIPVFFALYKVLFVTIEMRHAPFFGWVTDLSAVDPTNIFTAFGYLPWDAPSFLHLGVWPMIMCATMVVQQRLNPKPADEVQAMVMNYMPYLFLFLFASFPAGLVIYWAWNNVLSILQQLLINHRLTKKGLR